MTLSNTGWQDYRGKAEGVLIHTGSYKRHEMPVLTPVLTAGGFGAARNAD